jgi:Protein of unknown function (DUF1579)
MTPRKFFGILACLVLFGAAAAIAQSAEEKAKAKAAADEKAMMEAWSKYMTPGEPHKKLASMAGTWDTTVKSWMKPGDPPMESKGTSVSTMILGGRYLEQKFEGTFMDQPFTGIGYTGYDNASKKYVGSWIDSMSTGIMTTTGKEEGANKMSFTGEMDDFMTGKKAQYKQTVTIVDNDHHTFEMWGPDPTGKSYKMMEIQYTRRK